MQKTKAHRMSGRRHLFFSGAIRVGLFALLAAFLVQSNILASRVRSLNLEEMVNRADRIFSGRCVRVHVAEDPGTLQKATFVTFTVDRMVKGEPRPEMTIKVLGVQTPPREGEAGSHGAPRYREGEEVILFLYGDSRSGFTSPVGFGQGKFSVIRDKHGAHLALNAYGNRGLMERLSTRAEERLGGRAAEYHGRPGISPDDLLDMVKSLLP